MGVAWKPWIVMLVAVQVMAGGCTASRNTGEGAELIGTWSCLSLAGTHSTMRFSRASDGSVALSNRYTYKTGETGEFDETYAFDPANKLWTWNSTDSITGSKEAGTAAPWTGKTWRFDGTRVTQSGRKQGIQMIYTRLSSNEFRREFVVAPRGTRTSSSLCRRKT